MRITVRGWSVMMVDMALMLLAHEGLVWGSVISVIGFRVTAIISSETLSMEIRVPTWWDIQMRTDEGVVFQMFLTCKFFCNLLVNEEKTRTGGVLKELLVGGRPGFAGNGRRGVGSHGPQDHMDLLLDRLDWATIRGREWEWEGTRFEF